MWKRVAFCAVGIGVLSYVVYFNVKGGTFQTWYGVFWWLMAMAGLLFGVGNSICLKGKWRLSPNAQLVVFLIGLAVTAFAAKGGRATGGDWQELLEGVFLAFMYPDGIAKVLAKVLKL